MAGTSTCSLGNCSAAIWTGSVTSDRLPAGSWPSTTTGTVVVSVVGENPTIAQPYPLPACTGRFRSPRRASTVAGSLVRMRSSQVCPWSTCRGWESRSSFGGVLSVVRVTAAVVRFRRQELSSATAVTWCWPSVSEVVSTDTRSPAGSARSSTRTSTGAARPSGPTRTPTTTVPRMAPVGASSASVGGVVLVSHHQANAPAPVHQMAPMAAMNRTLARIVSGSASPRWPSRPASTRRRGRYPTSAPGHAVSSTERPSAWWCS